MIRRLLHLLAVASIPHVCHSEEINCTSLETTNGTFYVVPDFTASNCFYSWSNSSDHVFANDGGRVEELIISSNSTSLHTYSCHEIIKFYLDCMPEGHKMAKCHANCTGTTRLPIVTENTPKQWHIPVVVVLTLLVIAGILCFALRKGLSRCRKHDYTEGKPISNQNQENVGMV